MKLAKDLIPWKVTDISFRPHKYFWSFNASLHYDGELWRCVLRCCDYRMDGALTIRSRKAGAGVRTKNAMVILDPKGWRPVEIYKMHERDDASRGPSDNVGFEDIRLFVTDTGGLQGIAASQHLRRASRQSPLPEQVLLSFDDNYDIVDARPIRGAWKTEAQKNWAPFDRCVEPRFLYSIGEGKLFGATGPLTSDARVRASSIASSPHSPTAREARRARERADECADELDDRRQDRHKEHHPAFAGIALPSGCGGLRGGTQLVLVDHDEWLGLGHEMRLIDGRKVYWHVAYTVDSLGKLRSASPPFKLAPNGIEFAAGMVIDGERVVISFGLDDAECRLGETKLSAVLGILRPL